MKRNSIIFIGMLSLFGHIKSYEEEEYPQGMESVNIKGIAQNLASGIIMAKARSIASEAFFHPIKSLKGLPEAASDFIEGAQSIGAGALGASKFVTGLATANPFTATMVAATLLYKTGAIHRVGNALGWNYNSAYHYNNSQDHPFHIKVEFNDPSKGNKSISIDTKFSSNSYEESKHEVTVSIKDQGIMNRLTYFNPNAILQTQYKAILTKQLEPCNSENKKIETLIQTILRTFFNNQNNAKITITGFIYLKSEGMTDLATGRWLAPIACDIKKPKFLTWDQVGSLLYLQQVKNLIPTALTINGFSDINTKLLNQVATPSCLCYLTTRNDNVKMNPKKIYSLFENLGNLFPKKSSGNILVAQKRDDLVTQITTWINNHPEIDSEDITATLLIHYTYKPDFNLITGTTSNAINIMLAPCTEGDESQDDDEQEIPDSEIYQELTRDLLSKNPEKPKQTLIEKIKERLGSTEKQEVLNPIKVTIPTESVLQGNDKVTTQEPDEGIEANE